MRNFTQNPLYISQPSPCWPLPLITSSFGSPFCSSPIALSPFSSPGSPMPLPSKPKPRQDRVWCSMCEVDFKKQQVWDICDHFKMILFRYWFGSTVANNFYFVDLPPYLPCASSKKVCWNAFSYSMICAQVALLDSNVHPKPCVHPNPCVVQRNDGSRPCNCFYAGLCCW